MLKTYRYRLVPTCKQQAALQHTLDLCRNLYNCALEQRRMQRTTPVAQMREVTELKKEFTDYQGVHVHVLQNVIKKLNRSFENFFRRVKAGQKPGFPRFKGKDRFDSFAFNNTGFSLRVSICKSQRLAQSSCDSAAHCQRILRLSPSWSCGLATTGMRVSSLSTRRRYCQRVNSVSVWIWASKTSPHYRMVHSLPIPAFTKRHKQNCDGHSGELPDVRKVRIVASGPSNCFERFMSELPIAGWIFSTKNPRS